MAQGIVKSYDPNSGSGIVLLDTDKTEVYIQPGSLKDSIFITLRQGQRINFEIENVEDIFLEHCIIFSSYFSPISCSFPWI